MSKVDDMMITLGVIRKSKPEIDRGRVRRAVEAYARVQNITYEDAHQIRRNGNAGVPMVSPNKFEDAQYQEQQRRACVVHYRRYSMAVA